MEIFQNRYLKEYSTFKIGGKAQFVAEIRSTEDAIEAIEFANHHQLKWMTVGKGSNCLFSDQDYPGLVIVNCVHFFEQKDFFFKVGAGFSFAYLGIKTAQLGFSGLEFASGIPGSVGGAVYMNAGASGKETKDTLVEVTFIDEEKVVHRLTQKELVFSYRKSSFQKMKGIILDATFHLTPNPQAKTIQQKLLLNRIHSQPYQDPSIGCFFKNPSKEMPAGQLIDQCGLKGMSVGGASVSSMHANFIVNKEGASCADVLKLKELIKQKVYEKTGVLLEEEVQIFDDRTI
jgi:UDP-N-acetylmuramate dehydrogenase